MAASITIEPKAAAPAARARASQPLLAVRDVGIRFGGIVALDGVSFDLVRGQILGLIGPNGAGKTTLFNCLTRLYTPNSGDVLFEGESIARRLDAPDAWVTILVRIARAYSMPKVVTNFLLGTTPVHRIARMGISRTFQNLALFHRMSVLDNIRVGGHTQTRSDFISDSLRLPWVRRQEAGLNARVWELIEALDLREVAHRIVADLPTGTQKRVELARALAANPKLLLLDEPASGLNHHEVGELGVLIRRIRDERRITILLVEHHMNLVMSISDRVVALDFGRKIAEGSPAEVQNDPEVIRAYLGGGKQ